MYLYLIMSTGFGCWKKPHYWSSKVL